MIGAELAQSTDWTSELLAGLLSFALRATVILGLAWVLTRALRRASSATRHLIWTGAIAGVLALPMLQAFVPKWTVPVITVAATVDGQAQQSIALPMPNAAAEPALAERSPHSEVSDNLAGSSARVVPPPPNQRPASATMLRSALATVRADQVVTIAWLAIAVLLLVRLAIATARVAGWQRASRPVENERWLALLRRLCRQYRIERPVVLLESEDSDVPVTWGVVYPVILLPATTADAWDDEQRIAVLTHELAHVKRFDALTQLLAQFALALLWFHPLAWMAVRRMRQEREHACDDFVLTAGARASRYADDLLGLARRLSRPTAPAAAALAMARRSELEGRLLAILDPAMNRGGVRRARVQVSTLAVIAFAVPLAAFRPGARIVTKPTVSAVPAETHVAPSSPPDSQLAAVTRRPASPSGATPPRLWADDRTLATLSRRINALSAPSMRQINAPLGGAVRPDTEPPRPVDLQMLIEVTKAAKRMTSDHEKAELLALIAARYQRSDALRDAYLDAVFTMTGDYDKSRALLALLERDSLPLGAVPAVLRATTQMTSDVSRGTVLKRIPLTAFADTAVQRAYSGAITSMTSDVERGSAIGSLTKQRPLSPTVQMSLLRAMASMSSNVDKANSLLLFLDRQGMADDSIRRAFFATASTLTSDSDYRRVMTAVMR